MSFYVRFLANKLKEELRGKRIRKYKDSYFEWKRGVVEVKADPENYKIADIIDAIQEKHPGYMLQGCFHLNQVELMEYFWNERR